MTAAEPRLLEADLEAHLAQVGAALAAQDQHELVERLRVQGDLVRTAEAVVAIVGETKRGKSSLVNALVGLPDASPVDVDVATSSYLIFRHGDTLTATVHRFGEDEQNIDTSDIARYAAVGGDRSDGTVRAVEVRVPSVTLQGMTLVDTPGVGGLVAAHGRLTLEAVHRSSALVFVLSSDAPISSSELTFLRLASERIETIVFVIGKIDDRPDWRRLADDDRMLLAREGIRYADYPIVGVSARLGLAAAEESDPDLAAELLEESGLAEVQRLLSTVGSGAPLIAQANRLRAARTALEVAHHAAGERAKVAVGDPALRQALGREKERLAGLDNEAATWGKQLSKGVEQLQADIGRSARRQFADLRVAYVERALRGPKGELGGLQDDLAADLELTCRTLLGDLTGGLDQVARSVLTELVGDNYESVVHHLAEEQPELLLPELSSQISASSQVLDDISTFSMVSGGSILASLLPTWIGHLAAAAGMGAAAGTLGLVVPIVGVPFGVFWALRFRRGKQELNERSDLRVWAERTIAEVGQEVQSDLGFKLRDAQLELSSTLRAALLRHAQEVRAAAAACEAAIASDERERQQRVAEIQGQQQDLARLVGTTDRLIGSVGGRLSAIAVRSGA